MIIEYLIIDIIFLVSFYHTFNIKVLYQQLVTFLKCSMLFLGYFESLSKTLIRANLFEAVEFLGEIVEESFSHSVLEGSTVNHKFVEEV